MYESLFWWSRVIRKKSLKKYRTPFFGHLFWTSFLDTFFGHLFLDTFFEHLFLDTFFLDTFFWKYFYDVKLVAHYYNRNSDSTINVWFFLFIGLIKTTLMEYSWRITKITSFRWSLRVTHHAIAKSAFLTGH